MRTRLNPEVLKKGVTAGLTATAEEGAIMARKESEASPQHLEPNTINQWEALVRIRAKDVLIDLLGTKYPIALGPSLF